MTILSYKNADTIAIVPVRGQIRFIGYFAPFTILTHKAHQVETITRGRGVVVSQFKTIGVIGAGMMGSEIALVFALAGHPTIMPDENRGVAEKALDRLRSLLERGVARSSSLSIDSRARGAPTQQRWSAERPAIRPTRWRRLLAAVATSF
jgi:hypothetical protein